MFLSKPGGWRICKARVDKNKANADWVVEKTKNTLNNPISREQLIDILKNGASRKGLFRGGYRRTNRERYSSNTPHRGYRRSDYNREVHNYGRGDYSSNDYSSNTSHRGYRPSDYNREEYNYGRGDSYYDRGRLNNNRGRNRGYNQRGRYNRGNRGEKDSKYER
eukprot:TRINITY_DN7850_c0_g1_i2.p1 TRINITY_DN7850_c0_g1~~TRINITY_DN7850_c0_g1_i2.p1  ORF type:complete len:164 (-),score=24.83 TRINITY_DN7850_c0_g1_i2:52-543(-)